MSKFCILLSVVILVSGFCFFLSHANIVRQSKGQSRVTQKSRRLQTTTQSDYFFDGSGYGESGLDPNFGDTEGGDDDDDDDDYLGSGLDFKTPHVEPSSTVTPLVSSTTTQQTTFSTLTQVTVDVEPTESPVTLEAAIPKEVVKEHQAVPSANTTESPANTTDVMPDPRLSTPHFALNLTTSEASSSSSSPSTVPSTTTTTSTTTSTTALPTTITTATKITTVVTTTTARATTSTFPPVPTSRTSHRPARRTTTTTRKPATRTTTSFKDDDLDGGDDDDAITDLDNNLHPTPGKDADVGVSIDKQEEDTNEVLSNLPVMYRVSNLPKLAFLSQSGVLAGIIAGSIVVLLCLVLLIMFVVYHLKRKSEPAFDRSTRSPVKAGYKKALDKDIYG